MRAATIHVETDGVSFRIEGQVGTVGGGEGRGLTAHGPTFHGALRQLADKIEMQAKGEELPESVVARALDRIANPPGRSDYPRDTLVAVRKILDGTEEVAP